MNGVHCGIAVSSCSTDFSFMGSAAIYAFCNIELTISAMQITSASGVLVQLLACCIWHCDRVC